MPTTQTDENWELKAKEFCFKSEKDMLAAMYENKSISEIAEMLDCGKATIQRRLALHKIQKRGRGGPQLKSTQRYKMFHVDQRIVMFMGLTYCAKAIRVSNATLFKYKKYKQNKNGD
jgi:transposase